MKKEKLEINRREFDEKNIYLSIILTKGIQNQNDLDFIRSLVYDSCICSQLDVAYLLINKATNEEVEIFPTLTKLADFIGSDAPYISRKLNDKKPFKKWIVKKVRWNDYFWSKYYVSFDNEFGSCDDCDNGTDNRIDY